MAGPRGQAGEAESAQDRAHRPLRNPHAEAPLHDAAQVTPPPAHDPVRRRIRSRLDDLRKRAHLRGIEHGWTPRERAVGETRQPLRIVAMNPFVGKTVHWTVFCSSSPQRLSVHPATLRRLRPAAPLQHERQRQHPARRLGVSRARRLPAKLHRRKLAPRDRYRHLGSPRPTGRVNQHRSVLKRPVESGLRAAGMSRCGAQGGRKSRRKGVMKPT